MAGLAARTAGRRRGKRLRQPAYLPDRRACRSEREAVGEARLPLLEVWRGDEGSAYAITLDGLRAATRSADGRGPSTSLLDLFLDSLGQDSAQGLITAIYDPAMSRPRLADLSRLVFQAEQAGDSVAATIVSNGSISETSRRSNEPLADLTWKPEIVL